MLLSKPQIKLARLRKFDMVVFLGRRKELRVFKMNDDVDDDGNDEDEHDDHDDDKDFLVSIMQ